MNPQIILAIAFVNLLIGGFSRKNMQGLGIALLAYLVASAGYDQGFFAGGGGGGGRRLLADTYALSYGLFGSVMLWSVTWGSSYANIFR